MPKIITPQTFVLIPGFTRSERSYAGLINQRPKNSEVLVAPHPSIIPDANIDRFVKRFEGFLDQNKIDRPILVGHSLGGALAMEYAKVDPGRIQRLYLASAAGVYGNENPLQLFINMIKNISEGGGDKLPKVISNSSGLFRHLPMHVRLGYYAHKAHLIDYGLTVPTTIIWGQKDVLHPIWQGEKLHQSITGSTLVVLPNVGHDWIIRHPELFWQNVDHV